jgi:protein-tyrosine-phosphatase
MEACSAGLFPLGHIPPLTLEVLNEAGIPTDGLYSKGLTGLGFDDIDYLVNLSGLDLDRLIPPSFSGKLITNWVPDPFGEDIEAYRNARKELEWLVKEKLPRIIAAG